MATSAATIVAAMPAKARREIREHFEQANAYDPANAVAYDPPDQMHRRQLDLLIGRAIARETGDGRYWIDREAERLEEERQRAAARLVLKIILIVCVVAIGVVAIVAEVR